MSDNNRQAFLLRSGAFLVVGSLLSLLPFYGMVRLSLAGSVGLSLRYSYLTAPLLIAGVYYAISRLGESRSAPAVLTVFMLSVSFTVLAGIWQAGVSEWNIIGGLLPYSDAGGYYTDALRLLHGQKFTVFSSRRPLFPTSLAAILSLTDLDLRMALILLTGISVIAICAAAREVQRSLGLGKGVLMLLCLFMFYRRFIGTTLTEHLGLAFGCLAFALIWRSAEANRPGPVLFGLFLLTLGLNARAGPFLILPALVLWAAWAFREGKASVLRILGGGIAAVLLGFVANSVLLRATGIPGAAYSNFSYTLYGLVFGGDWSLALQQHPELAILPPLDQADRVYALAWEQIRMHPLALLGGSVRAWRAFFLGHSGTWFSFTLDRSPEWADLREMLLAEGVSALNFRRDVWVLLDVAAREAWIVALNVLMIAGGVMLWRNRRRPLAVLNFAAWAGILLSVPFVPPWDADNMRAYAATLPFVLALPVMGMCYDREGKATWPAGDHGGASSRLTDVVVLSGILIALLIAGPLTGLAGGAFKWPEGQEPSCAVGCKNRQVRLVELDPRNAIHLVESREVRDTGVIGNYVSVRNLRERKHIKDYPDVWYLWRGLSKLPAGTTLTLAFDLRGGNTVYIHSDSTMFPRSRGVIALCGEVIRSTWIDWFRADALGTC